MSENTPQAIPAPPWFLAVSATGLAWNLLGLAAFFMQMSMDLNQLSGAERAFYEQMPVWAKAGFGAAVFGGTLGCLALLLRRAWALPLLLLSVAGVLVQMFHSLVVADGLDIFGPQSLIMPVAVFVIAVFLAWFADYASGRGWMR